MVSYSTTTKNCPIRKGLRALGGRWSLIVLSVLIEPRRYGEIKKEMPDISEKMLIQTLRLLAEYALIKRKDYKEMPPHVEYRLTKKGRQALEIIPIIKKLEL